MERHRDSPKKTTTTAHKEKSPVKIKREPKVFDQDEPEYIISEKNNYIDLVDESPDDINQINVDEHMIDDDNDPVRHSYEKTPLNTIKPATGSSSVVATLVSLTKSNILCLIQQRAPNNNYSCLIYSVVFCFCLIIMSNFLGPKMNYNDTDENLLSSSNSNKLNDMSVFKNKFEAKLLALKEKYPNQSNSFWANIESSFRHSIISAKDPSIILMVSDQNTASLASRMSADLKESFVSIMQTNNANEELIISPKTDTELGKLIFDKKYDSVKKYVDSKLNRIFSKGHKFAFVQNIEQLPATTMLLFYTYGDDLMNAKFPGIVILMSVQLSDIAIEDLERAKLLNSSAKLSEYVEAYLFKLWSPYIHEDQLRPLFTRIANNVILVNNESILANNV